MTAAVEVRDLFRVYSTPEGSAAALQGLTLALQEREVVVVLGPSGSGKTTLLRILAGLDRPSAGTVRVLGADVPRLRRRELADYRAAVLGYADQHYTRALESELPARELVGLQLALLGTPRAERLRAADALLARVGLAEKRDARARELSGGEQQRVAVCAALAHRPRLLLADEPTGELDAANARVVYDLIGDLARSAGCTVVIVSHDPESASIADRVIQVRDGRVSGEAAHASTPEQIVVGRGGWLRLPEEFLRRSGIEARADARLERGGILIASPGAAGDGAAPAQPQVREPRPVADGVGAELRNVSKRFGRGAGRTRVFEHFSVRFPAGRLVAVTGPSGSGKTTLLHLLAGLELPNGGDMLVLGQVVSSADRAGRADFRRRHVALVRQEPGLIPFLSARENVELGLALRGADETGAGEALGAVGLGDLVEQRVERLSTGERQRVALARALAQKPDLLLADEPTARLDQANALTVGTLLAQLAGEGTTVVCATHDSVLLEQADEELSLAAVAQVPSGEG